MEDLVGNLTLEKINLKYYKIKKNDKYGVKIVKNQSDTEEYAEYKEFTESEEEIENFIKRLIKGEVTPITLRYIIEDMILEHIRKNFKIEKISK